jgi:dTMP kinase
MTEKRDASFGFSFFLYCIYSDNCVTTNFMNIYFTATTTGNGEVVRYGSILQSIQESGHTVVSGKQIVSPKLLKEDMKKTPEEIFRRQKDRIDEADCVVAEVTTKSSGVGGEVVYALVHNKPVLALFYKDAQNQLSPMIAGNPSEHLYLEHYEDDNIPIVLKHFFTEVENLKNRKGKLIVIDGGDGSGKATQSELLMDYLKKAGQRVKYLDFPRYYTSFHGKVVGRFLQGEFGTLDAVSPYLAALAYAIDRAGTKEEMDQWLSGGGVLLCNRYATSSMAHQGAKMPLSKQDEFVAWLDEMEYKVHKIPREDIVIYLYVPWKLGYELTLKKDQRKYIDGKLDIAEKDMHHREASEAMYLKLAGERKNWVTIDCVKDGAILPKEEIHQKILLALKKRHIL